MMANFNFSKISELIEKFFVTDKEDKKIKIVITLGLVGIFLIFMSNFWNVEGKKNSDVKSLKNKISDEVKQEKLQKNLENIVSAIHGAGKAKVLVTFESSSQTVYAVEEKKNKETSEDKSDGEITRKKESDDCEKKYITVKDSDGVERALAVTEIEPKVKGVIIICPGGDDMLVKSRIISAITTSLNISKKQVCVTKSR